MVLTLALICACKRACSLISDGGGGGLRGGVGGGGGEGVGDGWRRCLRWIANIIEWIHAIFKI